MQDYGNPTSHSYFSQRLRLHYLDWGNAGAPHLLLLHGIHDHCHSWDWMARRLRQRFHVMAPDLAWARRLPVDTGQQLRVARARAGHRAARPAGGTRTVTLVSHSMGGTIGALYAGIFPRAVQKLVIIKGVGLYPEDREAPVQRAISCWRTSCDRSRTALKELLRPIAPEGGGGLAPAQDRHLSAGVFPPGESEVLPNHLQAPPRRRPALQQTRTVSS